MLLTLDYVAQMARVCRCAQRFSILAPHSNPMNWTFENDVPIFQINYGLDVTVDSYYVTKLKQHIRALTFAITVTECFRVLIKNNNNCGPTIFQEGAWFFARSPGSKNPVLLINSKLGRTIHLLLKLNQMLQNLLIKCIREETLTIFP